MAIIRKQIEEIKKAKKQVAKLISPFTASQKRLTAGAKVGFQPSAERAGHGYKAPAVPAKSVSGNIGKFIGKRAGDIFTAGRYTQAIPQAVVGQATGGKVNTKKIGIGLSQNELESLAGLKPIPQRVVPTTKKVYSEVFKPLANTATAVKSTGQYVGAGAFGMGAQVVSNIKNKEKITKDLGSGFEQGTDNAWMFAITNKATDNVLQRFGGGKMLESSLSKAWTKASSIGLKQGGEALLKDVGKLWGKQVLRGIIETPAEGTAFTIKRMLERDDNIKDAFVEEFSSALIGNIIYHGGFSGLRTAGIGGKELVKSATETATQHLKTMDPGWQKSQAGFINPKEIFRVTPKPNAEIPKMEFSPPPVSQPKPISIDELASGTTGSKSFRGEMDNTMSRYQSGKGTERQLGEDAKFISDVFDKEAPAKIKQAVGDDLNGKIAYIQKQMNFQEGGKGISKVREVLDGAKRLMNDQRGFINIGADVTPKLKTGEGQGYKPQTQELLSKSSSDSIIPQDDKTLLDQAQKTLAPEKFEPGNEGMFKKVKESINSKFTGLRETVQDKMIRVKQLQDTPGAKVSDESDPYLKEELYHGRIATRLEAIKNEVTQIEKGIIETSKKAKFDIDGTRSLVNKYLQAIHTPERNAKLGDGASGMKTDEAERIIKEIDSSPAGKVIKDFADKALDLNRKTLDILKEAEVIDEGLYDTLRKTYKNHVPLQRVFEDTKALNDALTERGFQVKGTGIKRAKGSELQVDDILTNIYSNVQSAYVRAEKNRVDLATLKFARENKEIFGDLFKEIKPKAIGQTFGVDPKPILEKINDPLVLQLREKGKPVYLQINDPALSKAFQGVGQEKMPGFLKGVGAITRFYSGLHTRFNPEFAIPNLVRDSQEMAVYMASQKNTGFKGAFKAVGSNMGGSQKSVIEYMRGKDTKGARLYKQLLEDGGTTGGMSLSTRSKVEADVKDILTTYRSKPKLMTKKLFEAVDAYNTVIEDGTRLAVYKTALSQGVSREQAASMAKNATINFNRKGTAGPIINSLYMFSNASIQGSAKMLKAMKNPKVAGAVVTSVGGAVFAVSNYNDRVDPDWRDKVSEWDRASNLVVMLPPGKDGKTRYMTVPVSWGLKPISAFFNTTYDTMVGKNKSVYDSATKIASSILDAYNPVGGTDISSGVTPTILDPFLETARNKKWSGTMIKPDWKKGLPGPEQVFDNTKDKLTGKVAIGLSKGVEKATDRNINISPEMIKYTFEQNIGGAGRFVSKTINTVSSIAKGSLPDADETPFLSRFMKSRTKEESDRYVEKSKEKSFIKSLKQYDTGSDEQKKYMRNYLQQLNPEQRKSIMYKISEQGFQTSGVGTSDKVLRAQLYLDQMEDSPDQVLRDIKAGNITEEMEKEIKKQLKARIKAEIEKQIKEAQ